MTIFLSTCLLLVLLCPGLDALEVSTGYASQEVPVVEGTPEVVVAADTAKVKTVTCLENWNSRTCVTKGGSCFYDLTDTYLNGSIQSYKTRGCAEDCVSANATFSSVQYKYIQHIHYCCKNLICNFRSPDKPKRNLNGLECPNLGVAESAVSEGSDAIKCYGDETQCIEFVLVHDDRGVPDKVVKGCATPAFCELAKTSELNKYFSGTITRAQCCETLPSQK
ncbi:phospholipase A2 inhibitor and Ly6/PLAUR domain-containing protein-like [Lacerta agilis]|uniref:phospholipase A2 inhibitor and Ly6/PLAUR domain-containing protein-like n=1 Tax=Lacerta agilis TaxID=80427 RepID=UPI001419C62E|nr:phospholipase A2 inhibitor and Ly6/PLAUR domain-containing protein-like [Lacerta agilis]